MIDLKALVDPSHTVVVTQECQKAVIGAESTLPMLAEIAREQMIPNAARLVKAARAADVQVIHCLALKRADGKGSNTNARLFQGMAKKGGAPLAPGSVGAELIDEIGSPDEDLILTRLHGLGPMGGTDLDAVLRNLGCSTIVGIGVSVNVAMLNFAMDAVNAGYQFVLPRDAVAGIPVEYADAVIDNTLSLITTVTTTDEILSAWQ